ncbi:MAG: response regulator transcription factor [Verrucomicrobia bacterium]|nr:response regulator transcription factor [Verrucomicrobiota bacterium]
MIRIIIVEDQRLIGDSLAAMLNTRPGFSVVKTFVDAASVLAELHQVEADVALIDIRLGTETAFGLVKQLSTLRPTLALIWVTDVSEEFLVTQAFRAELKGFVHKSDSFEVLTAAVETVAAGGRFYSETVVQMRTRMRARPDFYNILLSEREQDVLKLIGAGLSNKETAALLGLSSGTIQAHRRNIMSRLELHTAAELMSYAVTRGFVDSKVLQAGSKRSPFKG